MPFGDGTGPRGMGPMTGRGLGYCTGVVQPGFTSPALVRGWFGLNRGFGRGIGRGRGRAIWRGFSPSMYYPRW